MNFGGEIQDPLVSSLEYPELSGLQLFSLAVLLVLAEHLWINLLKRSCDPFPHNTNRIHRINEDLCWRLEKASSHIGDHDLPSPTVDCRTLVAR